MVINRTQGFLSPEHHAQSLHEAVYSVRHSLCDSSCNQPPLVPAGARAATWELGALGGLCGGLQAGGFVLPHLGQCWQGWEVPLGTVGFRGWEVSVPPLRALSDPGVGTQEASLGNPPSPHPGWTKSHNKTCSGCRGSVCGTGRVGTTGTELVGTRKGHSMELQAPSRTMPFQWACPCASETLQPIHNWEGDAVQPHGQQIQLGFSLPECGTRSNLSFLKNVITECNGNASKRLQEQDPCLKS